MTGASPLRTPSPIDLDVAASVEFEAFLAEHRAHRAARRRMTSAERQTLEQREAIARPAMEDRPITIGRVKDLPPRRDRR